jgi:hypothetical protein
MTRNTVSKNVVDIHVSWELKIEWQVPVEGLPLKTFPLASDKVPKPLLEPINAGRSATRRFRPAEHPALVKRAACAANPRQSMISALLLNHVSGA